MKNFFALLTICILLSGCQALTDTGIIDDGDDEAYASEIPIIEPTATYYIAVGGVDWGRNELVIYNDDETVKDFTGHTLTFETDDIDVVDFSVRDDYDTFEAGSGAYLDAYECGSANVHYLMDAVKQSDVYKVIVPPQSLIQILIGEARSQLIDEATLDSSDNVTLDSQSPTGEAIASVVRNRIDYIDEDTNPGLFKDVKVAAANYYEDAPCSKYDAVINAESNGSYQFLPANPADASYDYFNNAHSRSNLKTMGEDYLIAYDQAVLTAGKVFAGEVDDPTGGAFAFRSPSESEWSSIKAALDSGTPIMPIGIGVSDATFPGFAPVQVVVLSDVAKYSNGRPTFIFTRQKPNADPSEPAVINLP